MKGKSHKNTKLYKLKQYWYVIRQLASREIKHGNSSKKLGQLWNIINPIISMITMTFIFAAVFHRDLREFTPYVFTGIIIYGFYNNSMEGSLRALSGNKSLLLRTKIPKNLLVIEKVYVSFIRMLFSLVGYVIVLFFTGVVITPHIAFLPVMIILSIFIMLGIGKILAVVNVYFADISYFYKIVMRLVFYASALFYNAEHLSPVMQQIIMFNPIYLSITFARACILYNGVPAPGIWIRLAVYAAIAYIIGTIVFRKGSQDVVAKL